MRKLFILLILIMSCSNQDGPSDLMSEEQMVNQYLRIYSNLKKKMRFIKDSIEIELNKETKKIMDSLSLVN